MGTVIDGVVVHTACSGDNEGDGSVEQGGIHSGCRTKHSIKYQPVVIAFALIEYLSPVPARRYCRNLVICDVDGDSFVAIL